MVVIRPLGPPEREWLRAAAARLFRGDILVSRGRVHRPLELPGFVACDAGDPIGVATCEIRGPRCELVSLDALRQGRGIGTALIEAVEAAARAASCTRVWLITTNDNTDALRFYQRRGYRLVAVHVGAVAESRRAKPSIPEVGYHGIPVRDEMELEKML